MYSTSTLIETIEITYGIPQRLEYHYTRMYRSGATLDFTPPPKCDLQASLERHIQSHDLAQIPSCRCTIEYREEISGLRSIPYQPRVIRSLLALSPTYPIEYSHKWSDRTCFAELSALCQKHQEPLIFIDDLLTDTTYTNVVIESHGIYLTPRTPLLRGTRRQYYLDQGTIHPDDITIDDCKRADRIHLINAMLPLGTLTFSPTQLQYK